MRLVPKHWSNELWVCSVRGHHLAASDKDEPVTTPAGGVGVDGHRLQRCLRCDDWVETASWSAASEKAAARTAAGRAPRRGKELEDAILLRLIAVLRGVHCVVFAALAVVLGYVQLHLARWQIGAQDLRMQLEDLIARGGRNGGRDWLVRLLDRVAGFHGSALRVLFITAIVYAVLEGIEAVGLWQEKRWAEYLTAVATVGFLPFEIDELAKHVTVLRLGALAVNLAVLGWLVWSKHLFGVRGGEPSLHNPPAHTPAHSVG